ncbi:tagaturonate reductase [Spiroplasma endosymbiont of Aspidapion aeneum]|uniref:tagaturonate reductase n=1 Tax=Spiroplasma endosymbiont of Aspidapion aeneum TaxID=3066276 RepID=UPI00313B047E
MKKINEIYKKTSNYKTKIIQFGEGNFLRAFIDWQIQQLNKATNFNGGVVIVQPIKDGMCEKLLEQKNLYTVVLEGIVNDKKFESSEIIDCINGVINPYKDYEEYLSLADNNEIKFIFSNTTEAGIIFDKKDVFNNKPHTTYPGKLTALLYRRYKNKMNGFYIMPCELNDNNGELLKNVIIQVANNWKLESDFLEWITNKNAFYSTLVDRIVPGFPKDDIQKIWEKNGYEDSMLVKAEPFLLFVLEGDKKIENELSFSKAKLNVKVTNNGKVWHDLKVKILNGPHTTMALVCRLLETQLVSDVMNNDKQYKFIRDELYDEIAKTIDLPMDEILNYARTIEDRFRNPFVKHKLDAISLNSVAKYKVRLLPSLLKFYEKEKKLPKRICIALASLLAIYGKFGPSTVKAVESDKNIIMDFENESKSTNYVKNILSKKIYWGIDLNEIPGLTNYINEILDEIKNGSISNIIESVG